MVLIDIDMPRSCKNCPCSKHYLEWAVHYDCYCNVKHKKILGQDNKTRPVWCPLARITK